MVKVEGAASGPTCPAREAFKSEAEIVITGIGVFQSGEIMTAGELAKSARVM
jgi:hypothetical protein